MTLEAVGKTKMSVSASESKTTKPTTPKIMNNFFKFFAGTAVCGTFWAPVISDCDPMVLLSAVIGPTDFFVEKDFAGDCGVSDFCGSTFGVVACGVGPAETVGLLNLDKSGRLISIMPPLNPNIFYLIIKINTTICRH